MNKKVAVNIKKTDALLQVVFGEVYAPNVPDSQGDFMLADDIRKMAHNFVRSLKARKVDVNHDNEPLEAAIVESFIATEGDKTYLEGAWVVGIKIDDDEVFKKVVEGEINGFSMEARVVPIEQEVIIEIPSVIKGETLENLDQGDKNHTHKFEIRFDDSGNFIGGKTDIVNKHDHNILRGTATEETNKHSHRFSFLEEVTINA